MYKLSVTSNTALADKLVEKLTELFPKQIEYVENSLADFAIHLEEFKTAVAYPWAIVHADESRSKVFAMLDKLGIQHSSKFDINSKGDAYPTKDIYFTVGEKFEVDELATAVGEFFEIEKTEQTKPRKARKTKIVQETEA